MPFGLDLSSLNLGQWLVIGLSVVVGIWFVAGVALNRRTGRAAGALISSSLEGYSCGTPRWLDLATLGVAVKPTIQGLPVERMEAVFSLERRENLPLFLFQHIAGKRDTLALRAILKKKPDFEAHLLQANELASVNALKTGREPPLHETDTADGFKLFTGGEPPEAIVSAFEDLGKRFKSDLVRLSMRPDSPNMLLHVRFPSMGEAVITLTRSLEGMTREMGPK
jgi:hypothetical protein